MPPPDPWWAQYGVPVLLLLLLSAVVVAAARAIWTGVRAQLEAQAQTIREASELQVRALAECQAQLRTQLEEIARVNEARVAEHTSASERIERLAVATAELSATIRAGAAGATPAPPRAR